MYVERQLVLEKGAPIKGFFCNMISAWDVAHLPAAKVAPIIESRWDTVFFQRNGELATYTHLCPNCKYMYKDTKTKGHNFCPNCGAKMIADLEKNSEVVY